MRTAISQVRQAATKAVLGRVALPRTWHLVKFPCSQSVRIVEIVAAQLAQRTEQALAISPPTLLARAIFIGSASWEHVSLGILPEDIKILSVRMLACRPGNPTGFPFHELQHFLNIRIWNISAQSRVYRIISTCFSPESESFVETYFHSGFIRIIFKNCTM